MEAIKEGACRVAYSGYIKLYGAYDLWFEDGGRHKGLYCRGCGEDQDPSQIIYDAITNQNPKNTACSKCDKYMLTFSEGDGWSRYPSKGHSCNPKCTEDKHSG